MNSERSWKRGARSIGVAVVSALVVVCGGKGVSTLEASPPPKAEFGTIKGRVVWGGGAVPKPEKIVVNKDTEVCGVKPLFSKELLVDPNTKGIGYAFAYVFKPTGANPEAEKTVLEKSAEVHVDQKQCEFVPYSTAMLQNQKLVFKSSDPVNHNVRYSAFTNQPFNQILPGNGQSQPIKLVAENRPLQLACDIHPWMKGAIMVFDHPFFAVTKEDGSFEIGGVPAGEQKLVVRLARGDYITQGPLHAITVKVEAGKTTDLGDIVKK
jgi:hypothetical protein